MDAQPDEVVGTALEGLLISSQDVAFDKDLMTSLGVTHILNVGYGIENAFPQVGYFPGLTWILANISVYIF